MNLKFFKMNLYNRYNDNVFVHMFTNKPKKRTTIMKILLQEKHKMIGQPTFGTFASPNTQADASACKRAKFLPTRTGDRNRICILQD